MRKNNRKGFTIVELVLVIAVIGILAGVMIPTISSIVTKAEKSAADSEARNIYNTHIIDNPDDVYADMYIKVDDTYYVVTEGNIDFDNTITEEDEAFDEDMKVIPVAAEDEGE